MKQAPVVAASCVMLPSQTANLLMLSIGRSLYGFFATRMNGLLNPTLALGHRHDSNRLMRDSLNLSLCTLTFVVTL